MNRLLKAGGPLFVVLAVGVFPSLSISAEENSAKALFEARCSMCHSTSRPLGKTKTPEQWRQTVTRMQERTAGKISDDEREIIIRYLSEIRGK